MALASMTGFGRARGTLSPRFAASVVVRSVNHRYLDVQVRTNLREETPELEAVVRSVVSEAVDRGRVTAQLTLERTEPAATLVMVDGRAVTSALAQLRHIEEEQGGPQTVELRDVLSLPGLVTVTGAETLLEAEEAEALEALVRDAVNQLRAMRLEEGERLRGQLDGEVEQLSAFLSALEPELDDVRERLLARLRERIERLLGSEVAADPERLVQEAALLADRADVSEEVVRLRAHLAAFTERLSRGGSVGRTLDFLCQEIHRELNTMGSKCREVGLAERVVEAKAATERLREQVQNLE
ncbi:MAG TPA: YicC family protein [Thermoanaerobaculales bacterium]|nr:YicC family protein [Thermoanaerobaculales bacterium]HPA80706.1 YicC family protein [Thermoanaerobaculales bacterium]HQL29241.1 YicC family protein [Thermoanaerobaculales bacterium]HQN96183.1 YicC family protein [Thermoanaerobaculales bacterium]HQP44728.1 YicC family protein [Thermoanaerobaculales bacterium]